MEIYYICLMFCELLELLRCWCHLHNLSVLSYLNTIFATILQVVTSPGICVFVQRIFLSFSSLLVVCYPSLGYIRKLHLWSMFSVCSIYTVYISFPNEIWTLSVWLHLTDIRKGTFSRWLLEWLDKSNKAKIKCFYQMMCSVVFMLWGFY